MNDNDVADALRSEKRLVLVEAPAGCGKTFQAAQYAQWLIPSLNLERLLILTHTNAACDVFSERTRGFSTRAEIRTIDSMILMIAKTYHQALGLPSEVSFWARRQTNGYDIVAQKVAKLLECAPYIAASLASRYPYVVCDEHQDSSDAQHRIILSIHHAGAVLRVFGDPMQSIYAKRNERDASNQRWNALQQSADCYLALSTPHRWRSHAPELGDWICEARNQLKNGNIIDLTRSYPAGLQIIRADNTASAHGQFTTDNRYQIDAFVRQSSKLLVLSSQNQTIQSLRAFFNRLIPIWEGHTRSALSMLEISCQQHHGDTAKIAEAFIVFVQSVATGFTNGAFADTLRREVEGNCSSVRRGKPALLQELARILIACPDHRGVADALKKLKEFIDGEKAFMNIKIDLWREFHEATQLASYAEIHAGFEEITRRRTVVRTPMPLKAISTIHKAKGLETDSVILLPCDEQSFNNTDGSRCRLYVALSRASKSLAIVIPQTGISPLFRI